MPVSAGQTLGPPGLWHPSVRRSWPGPWLHWHPGLGLPGASGAGGRPCCQPRRTRKMLLLSPALSSGTGSQGGGAEAAATAQPRPPGIFERCSWVPGGWQTWQRRVGRAPKPTTKKRRGLDDKERREDTTVPDHSAASLRTPEHQSSPSPGDSQPCRWAGWPWRHVVTAWLAKQF